MELTSDRQVCYWAIAIPEGNWSTCLSVASLPRFPPHGWMNADSLSRCYSDHPSLATASLLGWDTVLSSEHESHCCAGLTLPL